MSLLEVSLYIALSFLLGIPLVSVVFAASRSTADNDVVNNLTERNRTALYKMEKEIRRSLSDPSNLYSSGTWVRYTPPAGFNGTSVQPGMPVYFYFSMVPGEYWNNVDDNGNGLVDECMLNRWDTNTFTVSTIASGIDLNRSGFFVNGKAVTITLTSLGAAGNRSFSVTKTLTVYPRN